MRPETPIPLISLLAMSLTLVLCIATPVVLFLLLRRKHARMAAPLIAGGLAFYVSQMVLRLPLLQLGLPFLEKQGVVINRSFLFMLGLSLSAGLFEETARLGTYRLLLKDRRTWATGVAFGIGHGGVEAILLIGMTYVNNLVLSTLYNRGLLDAFLAGKVPAETANAIVNALLGTSPDLYLAAGLERVMTIVVHIALSLVVLEGIVNGRKALFWLLAVLLHTGMNLLATSLVEVGLSPWWSEAALLVMAIVALGYIRNAKKRFPSDTEDTDEAQKALEEGY